MAKYVTKIGEYYYYFRRVPAKMADYDDRRFVKISLKTKDETEAHRAAFVCHDYIENYWRSLVRAGSLDGREAKYKAAVNMARLHGFAYSTIGEISDSPLEEVIERTLVAYKRPEAAAAVMGVVGKPSLALSSVVERYWPLCGDRLAGKNEHQVRKWRRPREAAMKNFIEVVGDMSVAEISRSEVLSFRKWWIGRMESEGQIPDTVNKQMRMVKDMLHLVGIDAEIDTDFETMFANTRLKVVDRPRPPFEASYVQDVLLGSDALADMNHDARMLVLFMADTGARESELIGLDFGRDVFLEAEVPHIWIRENANRTLKTRSSDRMIPLVGSALKAISELPEGFTRYKNPDSASTAINKYLRERNLKPTKEHSLYSLRHTFKDRLRDVGAPEEVIDELMGHRKVGPQYGRGHLLETKMKWMEEIAFRVS